MLDFLIDLLSTVRYDIFLLCAVWIVARNLIRFWCMQKAIEKNFVDKEMMKLQLDFQKSLREMDANPASDFSENVQ